jgi:TPR repeat protein
MIFLSAILIAAMSSADAVLTLLNSPSSTGPRTYAAAKAKVESDARRGHALQQYVVGVTTGDRRLAAKYLEQSRPKIREMAEKRNNPLAWYLLSLENNDLELLQRAAKGGNVQALNALGTIAISKAFAAENLPTNSLEKILKRGFSMFSQAAAQRDANAMVNLGACYLRGFGCRPDWAMAFDCFKAAAELGHPEGMDNMSAAYELGHGVKPDAEKSLYWKMRARSARGDEAAAKWLTERK